MNSTGRVLGVATLASVLCFACQSPPGSGYDAPTAARGSYVFAWPDYPAGPVELRGGTSRGAAVELETQPSAAWETLAGERSDGPQRDRAAILALAGDYRVSFDFLETIVLGGGTTPAKPYRSWGTERVYVVEDTPHFVSLQHVMVMFVEGEDGVVQGPFVQKHWRQDWQYEPTQRLRFDGMGEWTVESVAPDRARGAWLQTVAQVDDTPRFSLLGRWEHEADHSTWTSEPAWRPLPRREHTVRDDYHAMDGHQRITILPTGWIHEQDHWKRVLDGPGRAAREPAVRARELGVARYDRLRDFDFAAGDAYWERTGPFWALVRDEWERRLVAGAHLPIGTRCDDQPVFVHLFGLAEEAASLDPADQRTRIATLIDCVLTP